MIPRKAKPLLWAAALLLLTVGGWLAIMLGDEDLDPMDDLLRPPVASDRPNGAAMLAAAVTPHYPPDWNTSAVSRMLRGSTPLDEERLAPLLEEASKAEKELADALKHEYWECPKYSGRPSDEVQPALNCVIASALTDFAQGRNPDGIRKLQLLLRAAARLKQTSSTGNSLRLLLLQPGITALLLSADGAAAIDAERAAELARLLQAGAFSREDLLHSFRAIQADQLELFTRTPLDPAGLLSLKQRFGYQRNATANLFASMTRRYLLLLGQVHDGQLSGRQFLNAIREAEEATASARWDWITPNFYGRTLVVGQSLFGRAPPGNATDHRLNTVTLACIRYRLKHGALPASLDALVPEFMPAPLLNLWTAQPFDYFPEHGVIMAQQPEPAPLPDPSTLTGLTGSGSPRWLRFPSRGN